MCEWVRFGNARPVDEAKKSFSDVLRAGVAPNLDHEETP